MIANDSIGLAYALHPGVSIVEIICDFGIYAFIRICHQIGKIDIELASNQPDCSFNYISGENPIAD